MEPDRTWSARRLTAVRLGFVSFLCLPPIVGQEIGHARGRMCRDALQHVRQPLLRIDAVQLARAQQRIDHGGPLGRIMRAGEQAILVADS